MKILLLTFGSRGDVQPYVALGQELRVAGHSVGLCTSQHFAGFVSNHGLAYLPMNNGFVELLASLEGRAGLERMQSLPGTLLTVARLARRVGPLQLETLEDAWRAARALRPDLILFHPKLPGAVDIADALGIPVIMATLFPQYVPTANFPCLGFPDFPLGARYRRLTYRIVGRLADRIGGGPVRAWRRANGLGPRPTQIGLLSDGRGRPIPALHGYSPHVCPRPADWPETAVTAGYWPLRSLPEWTPPAALAAFLAAGPPPVYVGFGSMAGRDPARLTATVLEALRLSGRRGLLASGWGGMVAQALSDDVLAIEEAPHEWLFPQVAAVVHHGGDNGGRAAGRPADGDLPVLR
jgi:sterol 3beta-glucosyltransferase